MKYIGLFLVISASLSTFSSANAVLEAQDGQSALVCPTAASTRPTQQTEKKEESPSVVEKIKKKLLSLGTRLARFKRKTLQFWRKTLQFLSISRR